MIILKLLTKFKFSQLNYFNEYIKYVDPKVVLTFSDNYPIFYKLKVPSKSKKIFAQAAYRTASKDDVFFYSKNLKKIKKLNKVDEMLVFNKKIGDKYKNFINGNIRIIGSFKSNAFKVNLKKKKYDILYISSWRDRNKDWKLTDTVDLQKIISAEVKLLNHIKNYVNKYNRQITIYGKYKSDKEKNFFKNIFEGSNWSFKVNDRLRSYIICDQAKLIISTVSTLGYEALARGSKVVVFNYMNFDKSTASKNFCWPYKIASKGAFWTDEISQNSCDKIINNVSKLNLREWKRVRDKNVGQILKYDEDNKILKSLLKKFLK